MYRNFIFIIFSSLIISILSCNGSVKSEYYEDATGPVNLVSVFADQEIYDNLLPVLQDSTVFGRIFPGLYYPPEVMFGIRQFDSDLLKRFKNTRLILDVVSGNNEIVFEKNKFAKPQAYVKVSGNSIAEISEILKQNQDSLINFYRWADREFVLSGNKSKARQETTQLDNLGVELLVPRDFSVVETNNDFVWFRKDNFNVIHNRHEADGGIVTDRSQDILNIMVFKVPFAKNEITREDAWFVLDSITRLYTKGSKPPQELYLKTNQGKDSIKTLMTDYIQIERNPALSEFYDFEKVQSTQYNEIYEAQGWWSMTLSQMGGPFTAKIIFDKQNKTMYVADAVLFAPLNQGVSKKRDYITQMESLFTTFKIKK
ncbi:MAG: DUF4837 family protein [Flavobacteriaceae bacterium]|nr:DUF4837 family protein [Flavobacteriaceae bacterium]